MDNSKNPDKTIDEVIEDLDKLHNNLTTGAQEIGYARDALKTIKPLWDEINSINFINPSDKALVRTSGEYLENYHTEIRNISGTAISLGSSIHDAAQSGHFFVTMVGTTSSLMGKSTESLVFNPPSSLISSKKDLYSRFASIDPDLTRVCQGIDEALYTLRTENVRVALFLIRQAFDHLLDRIAPDNKVRASQFWQQKKGDKLNQVFREERIKYAVATHIADPIKANMMLNALEHMLEVYNSLNQLHTRGRLDKIKSIEALKEMKKILENWADALNL